MTLLDRELTEHEGQSALFASAEQESLLARAAADIERWEREGIQLVTVLDEHYPDNLRAVYDRPALIFIAGELRRSAARSVAIIGSRRASAQGIMRAQGLATELAARGYTIVSGLAAGIDTAAHTAALAATGRTVAVIGTGLRHSYPPENAPLQREIAARGAVVSQFWPESGPSRDSFPARNATMSGLAAATVIVEASARSGARIQARSALAHGRPVFLAQELLTQAWAQELTARPGVTAFTAADEISAGLERRRERDMPTAEPSRHGDGL